MRNRLLSILGGGFYILITAIAIFKMPHYLAGSDNGADFLMTEPLKNFFSLWLDNNAIGLHEFHIKFMFLPLKIAYGIFNRFGINFSAFFFKLLIVVLLATAIFSFKKLLTLFEKSQPFASTAISIFYAFNITMLTILHWQPIYLYLFFFAFAPLFVYCLFVFLTREDRPAKNALFLALVNFLILPGISNPAMLFSLGVITVGILTWAIKKKCITKEKSAILALLILMNSFYLMPMAYEFFQIGKIQQTSGFQIQTSQSLSVDNGNNTSINMFQLLGGWGYFNNWTDGKPVIQFSTLYGWPLKAILFIPFLTLIGLYAVKRPTKKELAFFVILLGVAILYMAQNTPLGIAYEAMLKVPGLFAFRSTFTKIGPLLVAILAVLMALRAKEGFAKVVTISLSIYLLAISLIFFKGYFIRDFIYQGNLDSILNLKQQLNAGEKAMILPFPTYGSYRFRKNTDGKDMWLPSDVFNNALPENGILSIGYGTNAYTDRYLQGIQKADGNGVYLNADFYQKISDMGIEKIIVDKTFYDPFNSNYNYRNIEANLKENNYIDISDNDQFAVYKLPTRQERAVEYNGLSNYKKTSPGYYEARIALNPENRKLTLFQSYDNWRIYSKSNCHFAIGCIMAPSLAAESHYLDKGYANSWQISSLEKAKLNPKDIRKDSDGRESADIIIYYKPQDYANIGFAMSLIGLASFGTYLAYLGREK